MADESYTVVENWLLECPEYQALDHLDARVLLAIIKRLKHRNGVKFFKDKDILESAPFGFSDCGFPIGRNSFPRSMKRIKAAGFISISHQDGRRPEVQWIFRKSPHGGEGLTDSTPPTVVRVVPPSWGDTPPTVVHDSPRHGETYITKTKTTPVPADGFDQFWNAYPKKKAKLEAQKAWAKLKPDADLRSTIGKAILLQRNSPDWQKDGGQYIPKPASWLNGRRWEDELEVTAQAQSGPAVNDLTRKNLERLAARAQHAN